MNIEYCIRLTFVELIVGNTGKHNVLNSIINLIILYQIISLNTFVKGYCYNTITTRVQHIAYTLRGKNVGMI